MSGGATFLSFSAPWQAPWRWLVFLPSPPTGRERWTASGNRSWPLFEFFLRLLDYDHNPMQHTRSKGNERNMMNLTGRTILITGGSSGIGLAFALKFAELGNEVIVTGRRQAVLDEVKAKHPKLYTIQSDAADLAQIAALAVRVKADYPKLDVLMNNAGVMLQKSLKAPAANLAGLMTEMNINVGGVIGMTSAFIGILTANKGTLINVSSALA